MHFRVWLSVVKVWKLGFLQCHHACFELRVQWLNYEAFVSRVWIVEFSFASSLLQVKEDTTLSCGKLLRIASTAFLWLRFWTRRYFAVTEVCFLSYVLFKVSPITSYRFLLDVCLVATIIWICTDKGKRYINVFMVSIQVYRPICNLWNKFAALWGRPMSLTKVKRSANLNVRHLWRNLWLI